MPFKSDKQRRYLWSQKPEVAKKFAEHKNEGGYTDDGIATHYKNGKPKSPSQIAYERRVKVSNKQLAEDPLLQGIIGLSPLALPLAVNKGIETGEWGDAAIEGLGAAAGPLAGGAFKAAKAVAPRVAQFARGAKQVAKGDKRGKLAMEGALGKGRQKKGPLMPEIAYASNEFGAGIPDGVTSKFTKGSMRTNPEEYIERLGIDASHPKATKAARDIAYDIDETLAGNRVDPDSKMWRGAQLTGGRMDPKYNVPQPDEDLVQWARTSPEKWEELYGDLPYPSKDPIMMTAKAIRPGAKGAEKSISSFTPDMKLRGRPNQTAGDYMASTPSGPLGKAGAGPKLPDNPALARWIDGGKIKPGTPEGIANILRQGGFE